MVRIIGCRGIYFHESPISVRIRYIKPITIFVAICPYNMQEKSEDGSECSENYYISIADDTGVLRLMQLPKHLWISSDQAVSYKKRISVSMQS